MHGGRVESCSAVGIPNDGRQPGHRLIRFWRSCSRAGATFSSSRLLGEHWGAKRCQGRQSSTEKKRGGMLSKLREHESPKERANNWDKVDEGEGSRERDA